MDSLQKALVLTVAKTQPKMFSEIVACIVIGGTKDAIMTKVNSIATSGSLTAGLCDAVCDFFLSEEGAQIIQKAKAAYFEQK